MFDGWEEALAMTTFCYTRINHVNINTNTNINININIVIIYANEIKTFVYLIK